MKRIVSVVVFLAVIVSFSIPATVRVGIAEGFDPGALEVIERRFSDDGSKLSIALANIHAVVPGIEENRDKILKIVDMLKAKKVNMIIFPEFALTGYFWDDEKACWPYIEGGVMENNEKLLASLESKLDETLQFIILNTIRKSKEKKYYNSTIVINKKFDYRDPEYIYDKIFLPGIEKEYTISGLTDRLVINTEWGRFGFTTCYDYCFNLLLQDYSLEHHVDAIIQVASWRSQSVRDYSGMNVYSDVYYGYLWDLLMASQAASNQIWTIAVNAVGRHGISGAEFWGGSGIWAPSGMKLVQGSHTNEQIIIVRNIDIKGEIQFEKDDFNYALDFFEVYDQIMDKKLFLKNR